VYLVKGTRCYSKRDSTTHKTKYVPIGKTKQVGGERQYENNAWQTQKNQVKQHKIILNNINITKIKAEEKEKQHNRQMNGMQEQINNYNLGKISKEYDIQKNAQNAQEQNRKRDIAKIKLQKDGMQAQINNYNLGKISKEYDIQKNAQNAQEQNRQKGIF